MLSYEAKPHSEFKVPTITKNDIEKEVEEYFSKLSCISRPSEDYLKLSQFLNDLKDKDLTKEQVFSAETLIRLFKFVNNTLKNTDLKSRVLFSGIKDLYGAQFYLALQVYFHIYGFMSLEAFNTLVKTKKDPVILAKEMATEIFISVVEGRYSLKFCEECIPYFFGDKKNADSLETLMKFCNEFDLSDEQMCAFAKICPEGGVQKIFNILAHPDLKNCRHVFGVNLILMCMQSDDILSMLDNMQTRLVENISKMRYRLHCMDNMNRVEKETIEKFNANFQTVIIAIANNPEKIERIIELGLNLLRYDMKLAPTEIKIYQNGIFKKYTPKYLTKKNFEYLLNEDGSEYYDQETLDEMLEIQKLSAKKDSKEYKPVLEEKSFVIPKRSSLGCKC